MPFGFEVPAGAGSLVGGDGAPPVTLDSGWSVAGASCRFSIGDVGRVVWICVFGNLVGVGLRARNQHDFELEAFKFIVSFPLPWLESTVLSRHRLSTLRSSRGTTVSRSKTFFARPTQGLQIRLVSDRIVRIFARQNSFKILSEFRKILKILSEILKKLRLLNISRMFGEIPGKNHYNQCKFR